MQVHIKQLNVENDQVDCCSGWIHCPSSVIATKFCTSCSLHVTLRFCHLNANEQHYEQRIRTWCTIGRGNIGQTCTSHEYEAFRWPKLPLQHSKANSQSQNCRELLNCSDRPIGTAKQAKHVLRAWAGSTNTFFLQSLRSRTRGADN